MVLSAITADSPAGRVLLALRAGEMESFSCHARFSGFSQVAVDLVRAGLIERGDESYRITEAGRAACPFRNPLAAAMPATSQPKENTMPITRIAVRDAIIAAGPAGITRKALSETFGVPDNTIDNHVWHLCSGEKPEVARARRGVFVASRFAGEAFAAAQAKAGEFSLSIGAPGLGDLPAVTEKTLSAVDSMLDALPPLGAGAVHQPRATGPGAPTAPDLVHIEDARLIEFAIFSTGGFEIHTENGIVRLGKGALDKLRRFLGMFAEAV